MADNAKILVVKTARKDPPNEQHPGGYFCALCDHRKVFTLSLMPECRVYSDKFGHFAECHDVIINARRNNIKDCPRFAWRRPWWRRLFGV